MEIALIQYANPTAFVLLLFGVALFTFVMLLPALLELKRPRDAGPRIIMNDAIILEYLRKGKVMPLQSIEEERFGLDQTIVKKIADVIAVLPNLET